MATHSSVLAWRIPGTGKPGGLPSMGSHRVGHNWSDLAAAAAEMQGDSRKTSTSASLITWKPLTVWIATNCGKFLEMGIPDHLTCLLKNLYADQEATVRTGHGTMDWFQIGKGVHQGCIVTLLINFYSEWSECSSVISDPLQPHGLSVEFSRPEYWRG